MRQVMQIQIKQDELETAIKNYLKLQGLERPVVSVVFTQARSQGGRITTDIQLGEVSEYIPTDNLSDVVQSSGSNSASQSSIVPQQASKPAEEAVSIGSLISNVLDEPIPPVSKPLFGG